MARTRILNSDGKPTRFFWSDKHGADQRNRTVFKNADDGIKRMTGVVYDTVEGTFRKN